MNIAIFIFTIGCNHLGQFNNINNIKDRKVYSVVGQVNNSFDKPIDGCEIYLIKVKPGTIVSQGQVEKVPVAVTDDTGDFNFVFEGYDFKEFWVYFDAKEKGYITRHVELSKLSGSNLYPSLSNNPMIVNVVLLKDVENLHQYPPITDRLSGNETEL